MDTDKSTEMKPNEEKESVECGPGCNCGPSGKNRYSRMFIGAAVLLAAGALVVRAVIKDNSSSNTADTTAAGFATLPEPKSEPAEVKETKPVIAEDKLKELESLSELNTLAVDSFGVFVYLSGKDGEGSGVPLAQLRGAVQTIEPQLQGGKIALFELKKGTLDYDQLAQQMEVPGVLAMVKGRGMIPVTGEVTEAKLIQGFVAASSAGGCGCGSSGCK